MASSSASSAAAVAAPNVKGAAPMQTSQQPQPMQPGLLPWVERYRPKVLDDVSSNASIQHHGPTQQPTRD